ncbi:MAG: hypothetical protein SFT92_02460 [Rickettsiales bacterium]|nr:hypothetical protein [Rickettsiales bacterium]
MSTTDPDSTQPTVSKSSLQSFHTQNSAGQVSNAYAMISTIGNSFAYAIAKHDNPVEAAAWRKPEDIFLPDYLGADNNLGTKPIDYIPNATAAEQEQSIPLARARKIFNTLSPLLRGDIDITQGELKTTLRDAYAMLSPDTKFGAQHMHDIEILFNEYFLDPLVTNDWTCTMLVCPPHAAFTSGTFDPNTLPNAQDARYEFVYALDLITNDFAQLIGSAELQGYKPIRSAQSILNGRYLDDQQRVTPEAVEAMKKIRKTLGEATRAYHDGLYAETPITLSELKKALQSAHELLSDHTPEGLKHCQTIEATMQILNEKTKRLQEYTQFFDHEAIKRLVKAHDRQLSAGALDHVDTLVRKAAEGMEGPEGRFQ